MKNTVYPGSMGEMIEPIIPAVLKAKSSGAAKGDALLGAAVRANVRRIVSRLRSSEEALLAAQRAGKLKIVGARYDLDDGKVDFFHGAVRAPSQVPCDRMLKVGCVAVPRC